jgi:hypothetical protein
VALFGAFPAPCADSRTVVQIAKAAAILLVFYVELKSRPGPFSSRHVSSHLRFCRQDSFLAISSLLLHNLGFRNSQPGLPPRKILRRANGEAVLQIEYQTIHYFTRYTARNRIDEGCAERNVPKLLVIQFCRAPKNGDYGTPNDPKSVPSTLLLISSVAKNYH